MMAPDHVSLLADKDAPICLVPIRGAFDKLTSEEKHYAHHMCRASFHGTRILLRQTSEESEAIYDLIIALHKAVKGDWKALVRDGHVSEESLDDFLDYASMFLGNVGNRRSNSDRKFIPRIQSDAFQKLCQVNPETDSLFQIAAQGLYSPMPYQFGYPVDPTSASGYYPGTVPISEEEVESIQRFLQQNAILPENTRVSKTLKEDDPTSRSFILHVASSESSWQPDLSQSTLDLPGNPTISIATGDFSDCLEKVIMELRRAAVYAASDAARAMIDALIKSFQSGNHHEFKNAQTHWVSEKSPIVETVLGFIETYQDPHGVRGAWEGIVAIVNKEQSRKFSVLVDNASQLVAGLPWNGTFAGLQQGRLGAFENSSFIRPEFSSLGTIGYLKSEGPGGINLPNFEEICQNVGFKNMQFGNYNGANPPNEVIPFIGDDEIEFLRQHRDMTFKVEIACHELLGHGSGRLLMEESPGKYNFSIENPPINPLTSKPVTSWYLPGQTWASVFGANANAIEECRADGVALLLLTDKQVLGIFGFSDSSEYLASNVTYAGYLNFISKALGRLSMWDPQTKKWGEPHSQGEFALLRCMMECGPDLLTIIESEGNLQIKLNREKIESHAVPAISKFLLHLQVYKSTANVADGVAFFNRYSDVDQTFVNYRHIVMKEEPPRIQYVQPNTVEENGQISLKDDYLATREDLIQSWVDRAI